MISAIGFLATCLWAACTILIGPMGVRGRTRHPAEIPWAWICFALGACLYAVGIFLSGG
jgi:hypothetical protein